MCPLSHAVLHDEAEPTEEGDDGSGVHLDSSYEPESTATDSQHVKNMVGAAN